MFELLSDVLKDATSKFNKYTSTGKVYEAISGYLLSLAA